MPMSVERRTQLLEWAARRNAVIVEDDYDSEFRFSGRPLDTLHAADGRGRVIYVGSFSKSLLPSLRLGFLVAPPALHRALRAATYTAGWFVQWPAQAALAAMIRDGLLARHLRKMRRVYTERHRILVEALEGDLWRWLEPIPSVTGLHVAATLRKGGLDAEQKLVREAARRGVGFDPLSQYYAGGRRQAGVVLGYGGIESQAIPEGLRKLRNALSTL
jgi:GntR family transcriptional regulator/MocR family aminotransferase